MSAHPKVISIDAKRAAVAEFKEGGKAADIAAKHGVSTSALYQWKKKVEGGKTKRRRTKKTVVRKESPATVSHRNAILFLRKCRQELITGIKAGRISSFDTSHLMALLALNTLEGGS